MIEIITNYWVQWLCGIVSLAIAFGAKHYVKLQRDAWTREQKDKENRVRQELTDKFEEELKDVIKKSDIADSRMNAEIEALSEQLNNMSTGLLSIQGKQFRENCLRLLDLEHQITVLEYEEFEEDYTAYKALGGNHRGDALHDRVVEKFNASLIK